MNEKGEEKRVEERWRRAESVEGQRLGFSIEQGWTG